MVSELKKNKELNMNSLKLFQLAKSRGLEGTFLHSFFVFFPSVALLCNSKMPSTWHKSADFRFNSKSLDEFYVIFTVFMNSSYNIISFIDTLGIVQGLLFGTMLLLLHSKKNNPTLFLGLFIILFSLEPIPNVLESLALLQACPRLELLPVHFHFLTYPLFYIYIQKISIFNDENPSYWILIPGFLEVLLGLAVFFLPVAAKLELKASPYAIIYFVLGLGYTIFIGFLTIRWIIAHQKEIDNQFSQTLRKKLNWSKLFIYSSIGFHLLLSINFFTDSRQWYFFVNFVNVTLIYWVSFKGIVQENVVSLYLIVPNLDKQFSPIEKIVKPTSETKSINIASKVKHGFMVEEDMKEVLETVEDYIVSSQCYVKDNLTIVDIAKATNIHPKRISHSLNKKMGVNFNNYINKFRVEEAKTLLESNTNDHFSIEGIGMEVGFHSKSTFYSAFKKHEGCTPAKYGSV